MFAPLVPKAQAKAAAGPTRLAPQRSTITPQRFGNRAVEQPRLLEQGIGNQTIPGLPLRQTFNETGNDPRGHRQHEAKPESTAAPSSVSWDFGKISIFPPSSIRSGARANAQSIDDFNRVLDVDAPTTETSKPLAPPAVTAVMGAAGRRLDTQTRNFFETRFGRDLGHVRIHTDARAVKSADALNAKAYTVGHDIVFGQNEYVPESGPGKLLLAHELVHVAQQQNTTASGYAKLEIGNTSDRAEQEADAFALAAVLTPQDLWETNSSGRISHLVTPSSQPVLRRTPKGEPCTDPKLTTWAGCFDTDWYAPLSNGNGVDIKLRFKPNDSVDATKISLVQTVQALVDREPISIYFKDQKVDDPTSVDVGPRIRGTRDYGVDPKSDPATQAKVRAKNKATALSRMIDPWDPTAPGTAIDSFPGSSSPSLQPIKETGKKDAVMRDYPELDLESPADVTMSFETAAIAVEGVQKGAYYGSVRWGYAKGRTDTKATPLPLTLVSRSVPSSVFQDAAGLWNRSTTSQDKHSIGLPVTTEMFTNSSTAVLMDNPEKGKVYHLDINTRLEVTDNTDDAHKDWRNVIVVSGKWIGKTGWIKQEMLSATEVKTGKQR